MAGIAMVGDATSVAGFRPLGFAVFPVARAADARALWPKLRGSDYAVVFLTEPVYDALSDLIAEIADLPVPAFTILPGTGSRGGVGEARIARAIERALGTTLPVREEEE